MSDVKTAVRTLELFEAFAATKKPLPLLQLAAALGIPQSSCFALVRTLLGRGYLYETGRRAGYYPTQRLLDQAREIASHDPLLERVRPVLKALRDKTRETVVFAKRQGTRVVYLAVFESPHIVRYTAQAGDLRNLHATSLGKALLSEVPAGERKEILGKAGMTRRTPRTIVSKAAFDQEIEASRSRGFYMSLGDGVPDVGAIAIPVRVLNETYAVSVAGPLSRIEKAVASHVRVLRAAVQKIEIRPEA